MAVNKIRRNGSYAPLSAHYYKDDAIDEAGEAAELLYVRGLAFCADVLSDGFISERQLVRFVGVGMFDATERAARLVDVGLWESADGGYRVRSWLNWNRSRDEITDVMAKDRDRKASSKPVLDSDKPDPEPPNGGGHDADRIPNGIPADSDQKGERKPSGVQPHAGARAHSPRNSTPLHSTQEELLVIADAMPASDPFDEFWKLYPNKVKKQGARDSWQSKVIKTKTPVPLVLAALRAHIVRWQAEPEYPRFVPHPTSWLNGRRWLDESQPVLAAVPPSPVLASFEDFRMNAAGPEAAKFLGVAYVPRAKPPSDQTPRREWQARAAVEWIDERETEIRAALSEKRTG